jgi:hypothetical protein
MDETGLHEIRGPGEALDAKAMKEEAAVQFTGTYDEPDFYRVEANPLGFLRMAAPFLKAAAGSARRELDDIAIRPIGRPQTQDSHIISLSFIRQEDLRPPKRSRSWLRDRLGLLGCAIASIIGVMLVWGGVMYWRHEFFG